MPAPDRRTTAGLGLALAALAVALAACGPAAPTGSRQPSRSTATPTPTTSADGFDGFPAVTPHGSVVVASMVEHLPTTELSITYTPATLHLTFSWWCSSDGMAVEFHINGHEDAVGGGCGPGLDTVSWDNPEEAMPKYNLQVGTPSTFTLRLVAPRGGGTLPAEGEFALAIGEKTTPPLAAP
jgi:hypothetical protein